MFVLHHLRLKKTHSNKFFLLSDIKHFISMEILREVEPYQANTEVFVGDFVLMLLRALFFV